MSRRASSVAVLITALSLASVAPRANLPSPWLRARESTVVLAIEPAATTATVNSAFSLDIQVRGGSYQVTGVSACLSFDPAHLHVVDSSCNETDVLTPGGALPRAMRNSADNALGRIEFEAAMGLGGTLAGGTFSQPHAQVVPHSGSSPGLRQLTGTATPHLTAQWVARSW